ncbi:MAG: hypothetical protein R3C45_12610 [Phycisphaerales bacterium]
MSIMLSAMRCPLPMTPCSTGMRPVSQDVRAGAQTGSAAYAHWNRTPRCAIRSECGVFSQGEPRWLNASVCHWSVLISKIFGGLLRGAAGA